MSSIGDLTTSKYWDGVWIAKPAESRLMVQLRKISQWKYNRMLCGLLDRVEPNANVLELGCAPGSMLERIHRLRPALQLSGIDYAEEGCRKTASLLASLGLSPNVYLGDFRDTKTGTQFDLVTSFGVIEHFEDPSDIIRCHASYCKPGGIVAITIPNFESPVVRYFSQKFCPENRAIHNLKIMSRSALRTAMEKAGLKNITVGGDGLCHLHLLTSQSTVATKAYRAAGSAWNMVSTAIPPQLGWDSNLWVVGYAS